MALNVTNLEGNELADDYIRSSVPKSRWGDTWEVFKSSFGKLVLINLFTLITFMPGIVLMFCRSYYIRVFGVIYPFNPSIMYPLYPDVQGLTERVYLSADILFYGLLIVAGFFASLGISGAVYSIRKIINTHGEYTFKTFFHGIKVCYFATVLPVTVFLLFLYGTVLVGDWMNIVIATDGNAGAAITAYVFAIIATVLVGIYCAWLFAVGTSYRVSFTQLIKNSFVLMVGTPVQTIFMAGFSLIPVWLFLIGGILQILSYVVYVFIGFAFTLLCWTAFTQWTFDLYVNPSLKAVAEKENKQKSEKELALEKEEEDKRRALELLAAGKSELIARPIMPISAETAVPVLAKTFTRKDIATVGDKKAALGSAISAYEEAHKNDPVYVEYNRLFAEREKALPEETGKKGKKKKISSDNLLR